MKQKVSYVLAVAMLVGCMPGLGDTHANEQALKGGTENTPVTTSSAGKVDTGNKVTTSGVLTVAQAKEKGTGEACVEGYIVGYANNNKPYYMTEKAVSSNIMIADSLNESDQNKIMVVQLESKTQPRIDWNLNDHPENLHKKVRVTGNIAKYFWTSGIKGTSLIESVDSGEPAVEKFEVKATPASGNVVVGDQIELKCSVENATIHYAINSEEFKAYEGPISVDKVGAMSITAYAKKTTGEETEKVTFEYNARNIEDITIANVREQKTGNVAFKGTVTRRTEKGMYVQDETAAIYLYSNAIDKEIVPGDIVKVMGPLDTYNNLLQVRSPEVEKVAAGKLIAPKEITIKEFKDNGEAYESELIKFVDVKLGELNPTGDTKVKDGTGEVNIYKAPADIVLGLDRYTVIAIGAQFKETYQLTVASKEDIIGLQGIEKLQDIIIKQGGTFELPKTINVVENGKAIHKAITWNKEEQDKVDTSKKGEYIVTGTIEGGTPVSIKITVIAEGQLTIADIQGRAHTSPLRGQKVKDIEGIVTAIDGNTKKNFGFYMQSLEPDKDNKTSDGIYVRKVSHEVAVGDIVKVSGTVNEYIGHTTNPFSDKGNQLEITQINAEDIVKTENKKELPAPIIIGEGGRKAPNEVIDNDGFKEFDPEEDAIDFYESLECMRVEVREAQVVGPHKYDEIPVVPDKGKNSKNALTPQGGVIVTEGNFHPERVILAKGNQSLPKDVMVGDVFNGSVVGTMAYNDGNFKLLLSEELPSITKHSYDENPITTLTETENGLRIGSFNVENLGGNADQKKVNDIANVIVENMKLPDIIGLQEIQDNNGAPKVKKGDKAKLDGVVDASTTYNNLIEAINDAQKGDNKVKYAYAEISPEDGKDGGQPGGNIRVGALYRTDRVELAKAKAGDATTAVEVLKDSDGSAKLSLNPGRIAPQDPAFKGSRKSLVVEFIFKGQKVFLIGNHLKSKRGDDAAFGNRQPAVEHSSVARMKQVEVLNAFVKNILAVDHKAKIVLLGDLNDFQFSKTVNTLEGNELYNMIEKLPENERYSYNFQGNTQTLDNILVTKGLEDNTEIDILNMNSCKPKGVQISDHDPMLISIDMKGINQPVEESVKISEIQGKSHKSPFENKTVKDVEGVVTELNGKYGFYMQSVVEDGDEDTSEGIYIENSNPKVKVGNIVKVSGLVDEDAVQTGKKKNEVKLEITQIKAKNVAVIEKVKELPQAILIGEGGRVAPNQIIDNDGFSIFDPKEDAIDFYESLESMRVEIRNAQVVGGTNYYEIPVIPDRGKHSLNGLTPQGGVIVTKDNLHPEKIFLARGSEKVVDHAMVGDIFEGSITGIIGYSYDNYKLLLSSKLPEITPHKYDENPKTTLEQTKDGLRIAAFNVENLGGNAEQQKIDNIAKVIVDNFKLPDVISLEEIQDNSGKEDDGTVAADKVYSRLLKAIENAQQGKDKVKYEYVEIAPQDKKDGGQPGGNIRVGMLYRADRVKLAPGKAGDATTDAKVIKSTNGTPSLSLNPGRIATMDPAFTNTRKPLVVEFIFNGQKVFVIGNHLSSKRGDDAPFGNIQPPVQHSAVSRMEQVKILNAFVKDILALDSKANIVVLGDMNDFEFSDTVNTLEGNELYNMIEKLPENERYTYNYQGNSQVLDNVLVTKGLEGKTEIDILNMNSCRPGRLQLSDHDPIIIRMEVKKSSSGESSSGESSSSGGGSSIPVTAQPEVVIKTEGDTTKVSIADNFITDKVKESKDQTIVFEPKQGDKVAQNVSVDLDAKLVANLNSLKKDLAIKTEDLTIKLPYGFASDNESITVASRTLDIKKDASIKTMPKELEALGGYKLDVKVAGSTKDAFAKGIKLEVEVPKAVKDEGKLVAYVLEDGKWKYVPSKVVDGKLVATVKVSGELVVAESTKTFTDIQKHWAQRDIEILAAKQLIVGTGKDNFDPTAKLTRQDFGTVLARMFESEKGIDFKNSQKDITRAQMAVMIQEAMEANGIKQDKVANTNNLGKFKDTKELTLEEQQALAYMVELGVLKGTSGNTISPDTTLTRAEMSAVIIRLDKINN